MTIYLGSTYATYNYYANNSASALKEASSDPQISLSTKYYEKNIDKVSSVDDFVGDYRLFSYAMTAYGLSDMIYAKAFMTKVLNSDLSDSKSFANSLSDTRFATFAKAFSEIGGSSSTDAASTTEATDGADATDTTDTSTSTAATTEEVVAAYLEQSIEDSLGETDEGVKFALYFDRKASSVKSAYGLLADSALWKVVQTVYGLPENLGGMDVDTQARIVNSKFDVADLQDPEKVEKLLRRFTVLWDATENATSDPILQLFGVSNSSSSSSSSGDDILSLF